MNTPTFLFPFAIMAVAASIQALTAGTVINTADSGSGSLRNILAAATNGETITFDPTLNGATITLTSGELAISGLQVSIDASALSNGIKISGNNASRIFSISSGSSVTLSNLEIFNGRVAENTGGGISALQSQLNLIKTTVRNCYSAFDGGGLWANGVTGFVDRCSFLGNDAGGFGGGIYLIGTPPFTIQNSVLAGNRSPLGGGIATFAASPAITNCTIQGNSGAGIQQEFSGAPTLRNTIVWANRSGDGSIGSQQIRRGTSSTGVANVDFCLVEGVSGTASNLDGTVSTNNPNFIAPATPVDSSTPPSAIADLRVYTGSPILNVGSNAANSAPLDRAGRTRIQNTTIDLGAFEGGYVTFAYLHPTLTQTGDENGNGLSNFLEYATGIDPSAPDDSSVRPQISTSGGFRFLTSSQRFNAADTVAIWQTSPSLLANTWLEMLPGVNYTLDSVSNPTPTRQEVVMKLLDADPRRFYRQEFTDAN
jgi:Right handed beta helix region